MKKLTILLAICALLVASCKSGDGVMSCKKGIYTINTTEIGKAIEGYNGTTPLLITVQDDKVTAIEVLENDETPRYLQRAEDGILPALIGRTVEEVLGKQIDGVSGATYSSDALIANLNLGLRYYLEHKK